MGRELILGESGFPVNPADLLDNELLGSELLVDRQTFQLHAPAAAGKKGAVWRVRNRNGLDRALKLTDPGDYSQRQPLTELTYGLALEDHRCFARLEAAELITFDSPIGAITAVAFVSEWLDGYSLAAILGGAAGPVRPSTIRAYVNGISNALSALRHHGLAHDDLNFGNVIAARPPAGSRTSDLEFRVIDLGSIKRSSDHDPVKKKSIDDYRWVALHLSALHNAAKGCAANSTRDRRFLKELRPIIGALLEDDPISRLRDPSKLYEQVEAAWTRTTSHGRRTPTSPFEYLSAEQIADDDVFRAIFVQTMPWIDELNSEKPQVITGPRGCGKSTLLRWLSLKTQIQTLRRPSDTLWANISGFYVSCSIEIQNRLGWMTEEDMTHQRRNAVVHYFNLLLLREIVSTLALIKESQAESAWLQISIADETFLVELITQHLRGWQPNYYQGVSRLRQLSEAIRSRVLESHLAIRFNKVDDTTTTESTLGEVTEALASRFPIFRERPIVFLIDDFSYHRVPAVVQQALHRVVWQRHPSHSFKISSEKRGTAVTLPSGLTAEISREFEEVDLGSRAITAREVPLRAFATDLLNSRLQACSYAGTAEQLLGDSHWGHDEEGNQLTLAEAISRDGARPDTYHGIQCISQLCSGDVAALLLVFERIFRLGNVSQHTTAVVPATVQNRAIKDVSTELVEQVAAHYATGSAMHAFLTEFGRFVSDILRRAPVQIKGSNNRPQPQQIPRIEIDSVSSTYARLDRTPQLRSLYDDLLRRAVLIELPITRGLHHGETVLRLHLRRIFLPSFGAALGKNASLILTPEEFAALLGNPSERFQVHRRRRISQDLRQGSFDFGPGQ